jgi:hypothetical protein
MSKREKAKDVLKEKQLCRYWVEVRELATGSTRSLPLTAVREIRLPRDREAASLPSSDVLHLKDGAETVEAMTLDDLAERLRQRYSDTTHERRLFWERDREAEVRRKSAIHALIDLVVESLVDEIWAEQASPKTAGS